MAFSMLALFPGSPPSLARVYTASGFLGVGCTILLVTSLVMVGDLVGEKHQSTAAFVYGVMSFLDKLANGIVVQIIQGLQPSGHAHRFFYQSVESYGMMVFISLFVILLSLRLAFICVTRRRAKLRIVLNEGVEGYGSLDT